MRSIHASLEVLPIILHPVHMAVTSHIFAYTVADCMVLVTLLVEATVRAQFVGVDRRSFRHIFLNDRLQGVALHIWDNLRHYLSVTLEHSKDNSLVGSAATTLAGSVTPNHRFINFNLTEKRKLAVNFCHVLANLVSDTPSTLVGYAKLSLQFLSGNTVAGCGEKIDGIEPKLKRRAAILKRSVNRGVKMMAAPLARIGSFCLNLIPVGFPFALRAGMALSEPDLKYVFQTGLIRGELFEEVPYGYAVFDLGQFLLHGVTL